MTETRRIAIAFSGQPYALRVIAETALRAEQCGADSVWIADDFWTGRDAFSILPCVAFHTRSVRIGTGVTNPYTRSPALLALTLNTLTDDAAGRLMLGIGAGESWKGLYPPGANTISPLRHMRWSIDTIRALLAGQPADLDGSEFKIANTWQYLSDCLPPYQGQMPIYLGATGPRMTRLAGEIADGLILGLRARPDELPTRLSWLAQGAEGVGRDPSTIDTAKLMLVSVSSDRRAHPNVLRHVARIVADLPAETADALGYQPDRVARLGQAFRQADYDAAVALLTADMISAHAITGTLDSCLQQVAALTAAGIRLPILLPLGGELGLLLELIRAYRAAA